MTYDSHFLVWVEWSFYGWVIAGFLYFAGFYTGAATRAARDYIK